MKEFISGVAILLILLIFPLQSVRDTTNAHKISSLNEIVFNSIEQARFDGYFTEENIDETKEKIAGVFKVEKSEIEFNGTTSIKYRTSEFDEREKIEYKFIIPFKNIFGGASFLGLSDEVNNKNIVKEGHVFSEVLAPWRI